MNDDKLIKSSHKIQSKWLGYYDQSTFGNEIANDDLGSLLTWNINEAIEECFDEYEVLKNLKNKELTKR